MATQCPQAILVVTELVGPEAETPSVLVLLLLLLVVKSCTAAFAVSLLLVVVEVCWVYGEVDKMVLVVASPSPWELELLTLVVSKPQTLPMEISRTGLLGLAGFCC